LSGIDLRQCGGCGEKLQARFGGDERQLPLLQRAAAVVHDAVEEIDFFAGILDPVAIAGAAVVEPQRHQTRPRRVHGQLDPAGFVDRQRGARGQMQRQRHDPLIGDGGRNPHHERRHGIPLLAATEIRIRARALQHLDIGIGGRQRRAEIVHRLGAEIVQRQLQAGGFTGVELAVAVADAAAGTVVDETVAVDQHQRLRRVADAARLLPRMVLVGGDGDRRFAGRARLECQHDVARRVGAPGAVVAIRQRHTHQGIVDRAAGIAGDEIERLAAGRERRGQAGHLQRHRPLGADRHFRIAEQRAGELRPAVDGGADGRSRELLARARQGLADALLVLLVQAAEERVLVVTGGERERFAGAADDHRGAAVRIEQHRLGERFEIVGGGGAVEHVDEPRTLAVREARRFADVDAAIADRQRIAITVADVNADPVALVHGRDAALHRQRLRSRIHIVALVELRQLRRRRQNIEPQILREARPIDDHRRAGRVRRWEQHFGHQQHLVLEVDRVRRFVLERLVDEDVRLGEGAGRRAADEDVGDEVGVVAGIFRRVVRFADVGVAVGVPVAVQAAVVQIRHRIFEVEEIEPDVAAWNDLGVAAQQHPAHSPIDVGVANVTPQRFSAVAAVRRRRLDFGDGAHHRRHALRRLPRREALVGRPLRLRGQDQVFDRAALEARRRGRCEGTGERHRRTLGLDLRRHGRRHRDAHRPHEIPIDRRGREGRAGDEKSQECQGPKSKPT
jgi:hypothetical protein